VGPLGLTRLHDVLQLYAVFSLELAHPRLGRSPTHHQAQRACQEYSLHEFILMNILC
jgi:hypothetical protein